MRFDTRFDPWLVALVVLAAAVSLVVLPAVRFLAPGPHPGPLWFAFKGWVIWLVVIPCMLPQYYEVRETGLFLRQGWRKVLVPYASLVEIQPRSDSMSAPVFSTDRILVVTQEGKRFVIAVAEDQRFLKEVAKRCPQLEWRNFGLGIPLSPPSIS
jgi:PH (Pleckstrin Homology) domain-containing protein